MPVLIGSARFEEGREQGVGLCARFASAREAEVKAHARVSSDTAKYRWKLAHANRVATIGQLSSSIAHEINQPLSGVITNAQTASLWLQAESPNIAQALAALARIVRDGRRINDVISRIRAMIKKGASTEG